MTLLFHLISDYLCPAYQRRNSSRLLNIRIPGFHTISVAFHDLLMHAPRCLGWTIRLENPYRTLPRLGTHPR